MKVCESRTKTLGNEMKNWSWWICWVMTRQSCLLELNYLRRESQLRNGHPGRQDLDFFCYILYIFMASYAELVIKCYRMRLSCTVGLSGLLLGVNQGVWVGDPKSLPICRSSHCNLLLYIAEEGEYMGIWRLLDKKCQVIISCCLVKAYGTCLFLWIYEEKYSYWQPQPRGSV